MPDLEISTIIYIQLALGYKESIQGKRMLHWENKTKQHNPKQQQQQQIPQLLEK